MLISLKEAARMFRTSENKILRWTRQGVIPGIDRGGALHYDYRTLKSWAKQRRFRDQQPVDFSLEENSLSSSALHEAMHEGGVLFDVEGGDVASVFKSSLERIILPVGIDSETLLNKIMEREQLASTGIGNGVAIPHPRHPDPGVPQSGVIWACFLNDPIDFGAVDNKNVFVMFIMLNSSTKKHLHLLSELSFCLQQPSFVEFLHECQDEDSLLQQVQSVENKTADRPNRTVPCTP